MAENMKEREEVKVPIRQRKHIFDSPVEVSKMNAPTTLTAVSMVCTAFVLGLCFTVVSVPPLFIATSDGQHIYLCIMIPLLTVLCTLLSFYVSQHPQRMLNVMLVKLVREMELHSGYMSKALVQLEEAVKSNRSADVVPLNSTGKSFSIRSSIRSTRLLGDETLNGRFDVDLRDIFHHIDRLEEDDLIVGTVSVGKEWRWFGNVVEQMNSYKVRGLAYPVVHHQWNVIRSFARSIGRVEKLILSFYFYAAFRLAINTKRASNRDGSLNLAWRADISQPLVNLSPSTGRFAARSTGSCTDVNGNQRTPERDGVHSDPMWSPVDCALSEIGHPIRSAPDTQHGRGLFGREVELPQFPTVLTGADSRNSNVSGIRGSASPPMPLARTTAGSVPAASPLSLIVQPPPQAVKNNDASCNSTADTSAPQQRSTDHSRLAQESKRIETLIYIGTEEAMKTVDGSNATNNTTASPNFPHAENVANRAPPPPRIDDDAPSGCAASGDQQVSHAQPHVIPVVSSVVLQRGRRFLSDNCNVFLTMVVHRRRRKAAHREVNGGVSTYAAEALVAQRRDTSTTSRGNAPYFFSVGSNDSSRHLPYKLFCVQQRDGTAVGLTIVEQQLLDFHYCHEEAEPEQGWDGTPRRVDLTSLMVPGAKNSPPGSLIRAHSSKHSLSPQSYHSDRLDSSNPSASSAPPARHRDPNTTTNTTATTSEHPDSFVLASALLPDRPMRLTFLTLGVTEGNGDDALTDTTTTRSPRSSGITLPDFVEDRAMSEDRATAVASMSGDVASQHALSRDSAAADLQTVPVLESLINDILCVVTRMEITVTVPENTATMVKLVGVSLEDVSPTTSMVDGESNAPPLPLMPSGSLASTPKGSLRCSNLQLQKTVGQTFCEVIHLTP